MDYQHHYVIVRSDLSLADQCCQALHAATKAGKTFRIDDDDAIVFLAVENESELAEIVKEITVPYVRWDEDGFLNAIATASLPPDKRIAFKKYRCWKPEIKSCENVS